MGDQYSLFMKMDLSPFIGEWIAICDEDRIFHGPSFKSVFEKAKKECPQSRPLITKVPKEKTMIL